MIITELSIPGVKILEPKIFNDNRGYSTETYSKKTMESLGITNEFVLDYVAMNTAKGTIRGIHFQNNPHPQTKLVRVLQGEIMDIVVDLRKGSPTYKKWISHTLTADNHKQILIPNGCGHAFLTKSEHAVVLYKFDDYYNGELVRTIRWNDPEINIQWGISNPILSKGDMQAPFLCDSDVNFTIEVNP